MPNSLHILAFVVAAGLVLLGLWRWERHQRREAETQLATTQDDLAMTQGLLAMRNKTLERYQRRAAQIDSDLQRAEQRIAEAPEEDDAPQSSVLADILIRHRERQAASGQDESPDGDAT